MGVLQFVSKVTDGCLPRFSVACLSSEYQPYKWGWTILLFCYSSAHVKDALRIKRPYKGQN